MFSENVAYDMVKNINLNKVCKAMINICIEFTKYLHEAHVDD